MSDYFGWQGKKQAPKGKPEPEKRQPEPYSDSSHDNGLEVSETNVSDTFIGRLRKSWGRSP